MPDALLRECSYPGGCTVLVEHGRCPAHTLAADQLRGSSSARGYNRGWRKFAAWFRQHLIAHGILPVCGAALPGGPSTRDSQCKASGFTTATCLELDHDPPLQPRERHDPRAFHDVTRVGLLCKACHARKTQRERREGLIA